MQRSFPPARTTTTAHRRRPRFKQLKPQTEIVSKVAIVDGMYVRRWRRPGQITFPCMTTVWQARRETSDHCRYGPGGVSLSKPPPNNVSKQGRRSRRDVRLLSKKQRDKRRSRRVNFGVCPASRLVSKTRPMADSTRANAQGAFDRDNPILVPGRPLGLAEITPTICGAVASRVKERGRAMPRPIHVLLTLRQQIYASQSLQGEKIAIR